MKAKEFIPVSKPRNFVAKNQKTAGAGAHKDKKRAEKQGDVKHKAKQFAENVSEAPDSKFVGFMNKTLGQKADAPADKSAMPDFMKDAPIAGLDAMGYKAALDFGMKTLNKLTPTQKTKLSTKGENGVVNWLESQARKQGLLVTDDDDIDDQDENPTKTANGKFSWEDLDEVQDFLPDVFKDPAIKSWALVLTDGEPLPKKPAVGPFTVEINPGIPGENGYANADWKELDTLENLPDAIELAKGLAQKNPKQFIGILGADGKSAGFYWPGKGWSGLKEDAVDDFLARGGEIQHGKFRKPRKSEKTDYGSKHIGGQRDAIAGKAGKTLGRAAATNFKGGGKPVVGATYRSEGVAEESATKKLSGATPAPAPNPYLKDILMRHIDEVRHFVNTGYMDPTKPMFQELYEYFANEIPESVRRSPARLERRIGDMVAPYAKFYADQKLMNGQGVAEGDDPWGDQGRFAGDAKVNIGGTTLKKIQSGDTVSYFGEKAEVVGVNYDNNYARISANGKTLNVKLSDLKRVSGGVAEGSEIKIPTEDGITWQDIRLMAGEGKLTKKTVLQAIAVIRKQRREQGVAEGKIKLSTDPNWYGAEVGDYKASGPVVNIPANRLVGFEPDDKMNQPASKANVEKIVAGLKQGAKLPPLMVRQYKNGYQVLDGHHRFWAYKLLGVKSIPAQVVPAEDIEEITKQGVAEEESVAEATSVAVRLQRAADKQRAKSDASLARTPSSIPKKEEPKK